MLGHSSVTITLTVYSHVLPMIQRDAAAMDRLLGTDLGSERLAGASLRSPEPSLRSPLGGAVEGSLVRLPERREEED